MRRVKEECIRLKNIPLRDGDDVATWVKKHVKRKRQN